MATPVASIAIPTRGRPHYLDVTLATVVPQATHADAEVLVVSDGPDAATEATAARYGARFLALPHPRGANAARNAAIDAAGADLIVFVDDDVLAPAGWLQALLDGVRAAPQHDVFGGPIRARLEGGGPHVCGREGPPITALDLGTEDRDVPEVYSANMAVRRRSFERVGRFDETVAGRGEEDEWERRYVAAGGRVRYIAAAGLEHRRTAPDATTRALARAGFHLGKSARRNDVRKHRPPTLGRECRTLAGCAWHAARRRCALGLVFFAHSAGRISEALAEQRR